jgi:RNA polymerase sigma-70 factor (ECF subfamily)
MPETDDFPGLIERVRRGDDDAATEIVRRYEPELRRFIGMRLTSPSVRRFVDSFDICQSVLARFFVHVTNEELDLSDPQKLKAMLLTIARNRVYDAVAWQHAGKRDARRLYAGGEEPLDGVPDADDTPSRILAAQEIVAAVYDAIAPEDRPLVEARMQGQDWAELAKTAGSTPEAVRKRVTRAIDRAAKDLGLA